MTVCRVFTALLAGACLIAAPHLAAAFPGSGAAQPGAKVAGQEEPPASSHPVKEGVVLSPETPIALVNDKPITKAEYDRALEGYLRQFQRMSGNMHGGVAQANDQMKADVIQQLVDRELLYQESIKEPLAEAETLVNQQYDEYRARFPSQEEFDKALGDQGMDDAMLRDLIGRQVQVRHYVETEVVPGIVIGDETVRKFYDDNIDKFAVPEQVKASHILIRVEAGADAATRAAAKDKAADIRNRCVAGEDFAALAKEFSEDPGSAEGGGDLGFFAKEQMVPPFAEAAFALDSGEISEVVETRFGYHVIKVTERKAAAKREFSEVEESIGNYLRTQALDAAVKERLVVLRDGAKIDVVAPHL